MSTSTVPPQPTSREEDPRPPEDRRHRLRRRWLTAIVIVLLIGIPAGYLVISANQSRDSGLDKERESSATGLRDTWPSQMKRRIFEIPIPTGATNVAYYETSNWKSSRLYVQFTTSAQRLDEFLLKVGSSRSDLRDGEVAISDRDADIAGWNFTDGHEWSGITVEHPSPRPYQDITIDMTDPASPRVYVVSTTTP
ncbi:MULTISPECIES: hypothetical protein [Streptomyces]|uniref:Sugar kinase n=1 Tax=Streptomyces solicathayae TaxID=3081768 RepID=A0ABZ0LPJ9_9ACTN|nr:hypothetical protein [Streptomyces sp. HUAS YS2]WOX21195.1 hypothetical protein R2D22_07260 [Streptomyces sp. HUAS YS2]